MTSFSGPSAEGLSYSPTCAYTTFNISPITDTESSVPPISSTDGVSRSAFSQYVNQRFSFEAGRRYGWEGGIFSRPSRPIPCVQH